MPFGKSAKEPKKVLFLACLSFEAERLNHHPEWTNVYNTLEIFLSTHDADGVTEKDFELAAIIDLLIG